ncbi:MAG TPA: ribose-phosphate diphosphokinase [Steroidobacteraceae bacterium]
MGSTTCFALRESRDLASAVYRHAGLSVAPLEERDFEGGEFKLRPLETVRDRTALILQCLAGTAEASAGERLVRLLFLLYGLRDAGAQRRVALLPYLTFARKDRRTQTRDPVNSRYIVQLLEAAGVDRVVTLDVHNPAALDNAFRVPIDHLSALPMMVDHFATRLADEQLTIASPDIGGVKRAQIFRELLETRLGREVELAFFEKRRAKGVVSGDALVGTVKGRTVLVIDDLCATGNTLKRAAEVCNRVGARAVYAAVTHAPYSPGIVSVTADPGIAGVITTDSVGYHFGPLPPDCAGKLTVLSIAPLFGEAIQRMLSGKPLAPLLQHWPPDAGT